ncbi:hypothetical protein ABT336_13100 [Micromonospora sp. NPDC000207]|uniref:hypothetical protein n=1 Tax=Micromonospora sp. NPDC000207 TaxID=3154246 RepID=UPI003316F319
MHTTTLRGTCDNHRTYVAGCEPCRERSRTRRSTRYRQIAYGQLNPGYADTTPARHHITVLHDRYGMSYRHIAYAAEVRRDAVTGIAAGTQTRAYPTTVARILTVAPAQVVDFAAVDRALNRRRPLGQLSEREQVEVWQAWRRQRAGLPAGPKRFASQFGISRAKAERIQAAANRCTATNERNAA